MLHASRVPGWRMLLGSMLAAAVLASGVCLRAIADDEPARKDPPRSPDSKRDEGRKADTDPQHQIDQMRRELDQMHAEMRRMMEAMRRDFAGGPGGRPPVPSPREFAGGRFRPQGRLGVMVEAPSDAMADQLNLTKGQGLVLQDVQPDSAAAKAGLKTHDVIVELNGKPVPSDAREFAQMVAEVKADTPIDAVVMRKGKQETIKGIKLSDGQERPRGPGERPPERR